MTNMTNNQISVVRHELQWEDTLKTAIKAAIASAKGRFFTVCFEKADGSITVRNAQAKRLSALAGGRDNHAHSPTIPFFSVNDRGWRSFNVNRLVYLKIRGVVYELQGGKLVAKA